MYKLSFKKQVWIVKQSLTNTPILRIAQAQKIHRSAVYQILEKYKEDSWDGLKDHKTGRSETILNQNTILIILDLRKRFCYGACRIETVLRNKGFSISHRQIEKVLVRAGVVVANPKKQKTRKWVRYELPNPNDLWHTDWSYDPFTGKNLSVYLDDRTRLITSFALCQRATAENSIAILRQGIAEYGKPKAVMTDHGIQYYAGHPNAMQENTKFRQALDPLGIKHHLARINRPQTNGKVERWFLSYKTEYVTGSFASLKDYVRHYNEQRPHMSLLNKTPKEVWEELRNV